MTVEVDDGVGIGPGVLVGSWLEEPVEMNVGDIPVTVREPEDVPRLTLTVGVGNGDIVIETDPVSGTERVEE